jgi:hypothetical protein
MKNSNLTINRARALTGYQPMGGPKPSPPKTGSGVGAPPRPSLDPNWVPTPGAATIAISRPTNAAQRPRATVASASTLTTRGTHDPFDFVFSCPPYGNLEVYSDDPLDLSAMPDEEFDEAYAEIIGKACALLKPDRFACFVVGDYRDASGYYRSLPAITARAFEAAGCRLYNDAILLTAVGSLPVRARKQFEVSRKLGKTHQNILVFCNGDPKKAAAAVGAVEFGEGVDVFANGEPPGAEAGRGVEDAAGPPVGVVLPAPPAATIERVAATQLGGEV